MFWVAGPYITEFNLSGDAKKTQRVLKQYHIVILDPKFIKIYNSIPSHFLAPSFKNNITPSKIDWNLAIFGQSISKTKDRYI